MCAFSIRIEREGSASRVIWRRPRSLGHGRFWVGPWFLAGWRFNLKWELAPAPTAGQIVWKKDGRTGRHPTDGRPEEEGGRESAVNREKSLNVTHQGMEEELQSVRRVSHSVVEGRRRKSEWRGFKRACPVREDMEVGASERASKGGVVQKAKPTN